MSEGLEKKVSLFTVQGMTIAKERILEHLKNLFPPGDKRIKLGYEISLNFLEPNLWYDKQITEQRRKEAANKVALAKGIVFKDERIIDANERVKQEHLDKLRSLAIKKMEFSQSGGGISKFIPFIGKALFAGGILFLLGFLIFNYRSGIATNKNLFLILLILLSPLAILQLLFESTGISRILFPSALASMLITIFYGYRVGFWYVIALSALAGTMQGNDFQLTISSIFIGSVGIVCVKQIRSRTQLLTSALYLTIAYIIILLAFNFLHYNVSKELWQQMGLAILNSLMTPILVLGFAIILGNLFDITTDLTLLELSDLNRPMLKQLSTQTPGTYHHSIMVGTLAEAAAEAVAANPLLARTGAYYHDIGKIERRDYYIENQIVFNPHDTLPPEESAKILVSHVDSGLELAEKHRLPKVIKEIIAQHHGTSLIKYFYHKALKMQNSNVNEEQYRYPGPLPVSKETGIIMLADTVEASVRSLGQGNEEELREIVVELVEERFRDGQLDKCELSVKDLQTVEDSFISTLKAQAHQRIAYPSLSEIENREQKIRNRKFYDEKSHNN
jgi:putative nucleotidyltransferase with HDIG domain